MTRCYLWLAATTPRENFSMLMPGPQELMVIFGIVVLLFGASKIPQLGKGIGEGIRNFKKGLHGDPKTELTEGEAKEGK
jgi:sec-independent protein translocase protein TatA